jgi:hypothetical protein
MLQNWILHLSLSQLSLPIWGITTSAYPRLPLSGKFLPHVSKYANTMTDRRECFTPCLGGLDSLTIAATATAQGRLFGAIEIAYRAGKPPGNVGTGIDPTAGHLDPIPQFAC